MITNMYNCNGMSAGTAALFPVLAAGSTASPYFYELYLVQPLIAKTCADVAPVFQPVVTLESLTTVATGQYLANFHLEGAVSFIPCGSCGCAASQVVSLDFSVPIASATAPTSVAAVLGTSVNSIAAAPCRRCGSVMSAVIPMTLTVTTAA